MRELILTRHNELVDPILSVWGWEIPVYLFLGGLVAGMMIITGSFLWKGRHQERSCACGLLPGISLVLLSAGMLALFLDLEHKLFVWRLYTAFEITSPMSWGAWILVLVYPVLAATLVAGAPLLLRDLFASVDRANAWFTAVPSRVKIVGGASIGGGVLLGIYTGVLLSALGARPLWNSALLGPLFLTSGLSAAAAFTHMVAGNADERARMARADNLLLGAELVLIGLFLVGLLSSSQAHVEAARLVLGGPFTAAFWVFVILLGIVLPLVIQTLTVSHRAMHTAVAPLLVLGGGVALRFVIVYAGQASRWVG